MRQKVVDALTPLDIEVAWGSYEGQSDEYIIFSIYNNQINDECEDEYLSEVYYVTLTYWSKSFSMLKKEKLIKQSMKTAGFAFDNSKDLFEGAMKGISMDFIFEKIKEA